MRSLTFLLFACTSAFAQVPPVPDLKSAAVLDLPEGGRLVAQAVPYPLPDGKGSMQAIWKIKADGKLDATFNGSGFVAFPFWGFQEAVRQVALQRIDGDESIFVFGTATDPRHPNIPVGCEDSDCGVFFTATRLLLDGQVDMSFNHSGKLAISSPSVFLEMRLAGDAIELYDDNHYLGAIRSDLGFDLTPGSPVRSVPFFDVQALWRSSNTGPNAASFAISQQGSDLFATIQAADEAGVSRWWVVPATRRAWHQSSQIHRGDIHATRGVPLAGFASGDDSVSAVGKIEFDFTDRAHGQVTWTIGGITRVEPIVRQASAASGCTWASRSGPAVGARLNGFWSDPRDPGWALFLAGTQKELEARWFTYDSRGQPIVVESRIGNAHGVYAGAIYSSTSPMGSLLVGPGTESEATFGYEFPPGSGFDVPFTSRVVRHLDLERIPTTCQ